MNIVISEGGDWWSYGKEFRCHICGTPGTAYWCGRGCRGVLCAKCVNTPGPRCTKCEGETAEGP